MTGKRKSRGVATLPKKPVAIGKAPRKRVGVGKLPKKINVSTIGLVQ